MPRVAAAGAAADAVSRRRSVADGDVDVTGIEIRVAMQGLDDATADITLSCSWRYLNVILNAAHAADMAHDLLGPRALDQPLDLACEGHVAIVYRRLDTLGNTRAEL